MIYTDKIHVVADILIELHNFACGIGLNRNYFHGVRKKHPHYDVTNKYMLEKVLQHAKVVSSKEILTKSKLMA